MIWRPSVPDKDGGWKNGSWRRQSASQKLRANRLASASCWTWVRMTRSRCSIKNVFLAPHHNGQKIEFNSFGRGGRPLKFWHRRGDELFHPRKRGLFLAGQADRKIGNVSPALQHAVGKQIGRAS